MRVKISKTSVYIESKSDVEVSYHNKKISDVHPNAYWSTATELHWRTCKTLKEVKENDTWGQQWLNEGQNHREEKGMVVSDLPNTDILVIDFDWNDLPEFIKKYGDIVICNSDFKEIPLEIEIYDGYRE